MEKWNKVEKKVGVKEEYHVLLQLWHVASGWKQILPGLRRESAAEQYWLSETGSERMAEERGGAAAYENGDACGSADEGL